VCCHFVLIINLHAFLNLSNTYKLSVSKNMPEAHKKIHEYPNVSVELLNKMGMIGNWNLLDGKMETGFKFQVEMKIEMGDI